MTADQSGRGMTGDECLECGESHPDQLRHQWPCQGRSGGRCVHPSCKPGRGLTRAHDIEAVLNSGGGVTHYCHVCGQMGVGLAPMLPCPGPPTSGRGESVPLVCRWCRRTNGHEPYCTGYEPGRSHSPEQGPSDARVQSPEPLDNCRKCGTPNRPQRNTCIADYDHDFGIVCPNCGKPVRYGSEHMRGTNEIDARWICR